jgi:hypothetical protein
MLGVGDVLDGAIAVVIDVGHGYLFLVLLRGMVWRGLGMYGGGTPPHPKFHFRGVTGLECVGCGEGLPSKYSFREGYG